MRPDTTLLGTGGTVETAAARRKRRLAAYPAPHRRAVASLAARSAALEDLADSFPALLFALATGYGPADARAMATAMLQAGKPLRDVAGRLGLPLWTRKLPAAALAQPLAPLPDDDGFAVAIVNCIPDDARQAAGWLARTSAGVRLLGPDAALWLAREPRLLPHTTSDAGFAWLVAWTWASLTPDAPGHALLRRSWAPSLGWKRTREEMVIWKKRVELIGALAGGARDPWFLDGSVNGFDFVHLTTPADFVAESVAMDNCLDQYAAPLGYGRIRVYSIRRNGRPVADLELALRADEPTMPHIVQVRGARNRRALPAVWQAVHAWMGAQAFRPLSPTPTSPHAAREATRQFWRPYLARLTDLGLDDLGAIARTGSRAREASLDDAA